MNILYHHRTTATGAAGRHIREMVKAFKKLNHSVNIVSLPGVEMSTVAKTGAQKKSRYFIPQIIFELFEIFYNGIAFFRIQRRLTKQKYSLIYERYAIFNVAGLVAARLFGIPIIIEVSFTSKTAVFPKRTRILSPLAYMFDRFIFGNVNGIVVVSSVLKDNLVGNFQVPEGKILVLPNAVDVDTFRPEIKYGSVKQKYGLDSNKIVGFVGGFYPWHGLDLLMDAAEKVLELIPNTKFFLIGDGPIRDDLERRVKKSILKDAAIFTGSIPYSDLPRYIAAFDIGVVPNSTNYSSPLKMFEYMAMGKPVLAPRLAPIKEVIKDGVSGVLFEPRDKEALSEAIIRLLTDQELCERISSYARKQILERHIWIKHAECILSRWIRDDSGNGSFDAVNSNS